MNVPFNINMLKEQIPNLKKKRIKWVKIILTIGALAVSLGIDIVIPTAFYMLYRVLTPAGFWQLLAMMVIGLYTTAFEVIIFIASTALLIIFLGEVVWP
jgi:hypothetical protein